MDVRRGIPPLDKVLSRLDHQVAVLEREVENPQLRDGPDRERVDRFLVLAYQRHWSISTRNVD